MSGFFKLTIPFINNNNLFISTFHMKFQALRAYKAPSQASFVGKGL